MLLLMLQLNTVINELNRWKSQIEKITIKRWSTLVVVLVDTSIITLMNTIIVRNFVLPEAFITSTCDPIF